MCIIYAVIALNVLSIPVVIGLSVFQKSNEEELEDFKDAYWNS